MRYRRCECKKNPRRRKNPFVEGETVVRDHGGGAYGGSYTYYKVLKVHADGTADLFNTGSGQTFKNVSEGGLLDRRTLEPIWKRKNPSAVYGAFRANPEWSEAELFAFLRQHPSGITVKELVFGFGGYPQGHKARLEKLVERGALKREHWAKGGDHYLLPAKGNPASPLQQMQLVARQVAAFKNNYHIPKRRREIARAIVRMLDKYPMSGQALPWDVLAGIRSAAREAEVASGRQQVVRAQVGDRVSFYDSGSGLQKSGRVVSVGSGEYTVQVGDYGYYVRSHDIARVYPS